MNAVGMSRTSTALDNLRGFAILNVVAFHACIAYLNSQPASALPFDKPPYGWTTNPIVDSARWLGFDLYCAFQYVYLMHLMFFLSGLFVWSSLQRKGGKTFLFDRILRIGVPFVLGVYLLMPLAYYPVYLVTAVDPAWPTFWTQWTALPFWPSGPMWFLWLLLAFNIIAAALFRLAPGVGEYLGRLSSGAGSHPVRYCLALAAVTALAYVPLSLIYKPWQWVGYGPFNFQPSFVLQYAIYFFAGVGLGAYGFERGLLGPDGMLVRRWGRWVAAAPAAFALWIIPSALIVKGPGAGVPGLHLVADIGFVLASSTACLAFAAVFLRFATAHQPLLHSLSENAYGIYFLHYVFLIWAQYLLLTVSLPAIAKAVIVFAVTLALSWGVTAAFCSLSIGARLMRGKRRVLASASAPANGRYSKELSE